MPRRERSESVRRTVVVWMPLRTSMSSSVSVPERCSSMPAAPRQLEALRAMICGRWASYSSNSQLTAALTRPSAHPGGPASTAAAQTPSLSSCSRPTAYTPR